MSESYLNLVGVGLILASVLGTMMYLFYAIRRLKHRLFALAQNDLDYLITRKEAIASLDSINATIITAQNVGAEWGQIARVIDSSLDSLSPPDLRRRQKHIVHFYHRPQDLSHRSLINGARELLKSNFFMMWVYSEKEYPDFQRNMIAAFREETSSAEEVLPRCAFVPMTSDLERVPVNFSVVAPLTDAPTLVYLRFPQDDALNFALRLEARSQLTNMFERFALHCTTLLNEDKGSDEQWQELIEAAKIRIGPEVNAVK